MLSGDVHLLSAPHAKILQLMDQGIRDQKLIDHIMTEYQYSYEEAVGFSNTLYRDYKNIGLVAPSWN